jgi:hypothetical protein
MDRNTSRKPCRRVGTSWHDVFSPSWRDKPHATTITEIAAACAALDYGYAPWVSHQIDEVIARDEEGSPAAERRPLHDNSRGS